MVEDVTESKRVEYTLSNIVEDVTENKRVEYTMSKLYENKKVLKNYPRDLAQV